MISYQFKQIGFIILYIGSFSVFAQQPNRQAQKHLYENRYHAAVQVLIPDNKILEIGDENLILLGQAFLLRGELYRDLAALQNQIGMDYFWNRDTRDAAVKTTYDAYFFGRYLFQQGMFNKAAQQLNKAASRSKTILKQKAAIWRAAAQFKDGNIKAAKLIFSKTYTNAELELEKQLAMWVTGQPFQGTSTSLAGVGIQQKRLALWVAAKGEDSKRMLAISNQIIDNLTPDYKKKVNGQLTLQFYDPSTLEILSYANYMLAAVSFQAIKNVQYLDNAFYYAGQAYYEAGEWEKAGRQFDKMRSATPLSRIYKGGLAWRKGDHNSTEANWLSIQASSNAHILSLYCHVLSIIPGYKKEVLYCGKKIKSSFDGNMDLVQTVAASFLNVDERHKAFELLQAHYPILKHNKTAYIKPHYLIRFSLIKYQIGRQYYSQILGHLSAVKETIPEIQPMLNMARAFMAPDNPNAAKEKRISF
ncbi:hypothetical protein KAR48_03680 [bacterium]|nr:hypothetical protein [bacterium]